MNPLWHNNFLKHAGKEEEGEVCLKVEPSSRFSRATATGRLCAAAAAVQAAADTFSRSSKTISALGICIAPSKNGKLSQ